MEHREVDRQVEVLIPADRCLARPVVAAMEYREVDRPVEVLIPAGQCPARLVAAVMEAEETAAGRQVADRAEATPEAHRTAALPVAITVTAK
jgi:hypothetical protein